MSDTPIPVLAVFVKRFPRSSETFILNEFLELRRQGLSACLVAARDPGESWSHPEAAALLPEVRYLQTDVRAIERYPIGVERAVRWALDRRSMGALRRLADALALVDVLDELAAGAPTARTVHLHAHFANAPAASAYVAHLITGVRFSFTAHAKDLYTTRVDHLAERCRAAEFVATCTQANGRYLADVVGVDPSRLLVCPHGIDLGRFAGVERRPVRGRIVSVARLVPKKGLDVLIEACRLLADRKIPFECRIVGNGPLRAALRAQIENLGLSGRVRIEPERPQPELADAYATADVFALAPAIQPDGDRDGIPNVVLEAMAAGLPVVTTAISGLPEVIRDGVTGRLVASGDARALADAIGDVLADETERKRLGAAARRFAAEHFALYRSVQPLATIFADRLRRLADPRRPATQATAGLP